MTVDEFNDKLGAATDRLVEGFAKAWNAYQEECDRIGPVNIPIHLMKAVIEHQKGRMEAGMSAAGIGE